MTWISDLQDRHESHLLSWGETNSGPSHSIQWHIECKSGFDSEPRMYQLANKQKVKGAIKGVGSGPTKSAAKQIAAEKALQVSDRGVSNAVLVWSPDIMPKTLEAEKNH